MPPISLHFSEPLIRAAVRAFWWRRTGWKFWLGLLFLGICLATLLWTGDHSWEVGVVGPVLGIGVAMGTALYGVHRHASLARLRRMRSPMATMELGEEHLGFASDVGSSQLRWDAVTELWRFPGFWLLFLSRAQFITLPTADLDPAARDFIVTRLRSNAVRVS